MKMTLIRMSCSPDGIFSILEVDGGVNYHCAEHAYDSKPKIPNGIYKCKRGHFPKHGETFEVMNVPKHTAILFHKGNYPQIDSEGCILLGMARDKNMVIQSKMAFTEFMEILDGIDEFELEVK